MIKNHHNVDVNMNFGEPIESLSYYITKNLDVKSFITFIDHGMNLELFYIYYQEFNEHSLSIQVIFLNIQNYLICLTTKLNFRKLLNFLQNVIMQ